MFRVEIDQQNLLLLLYHFYALFKNGRKSCPPSPALSWDCPLLTPPSLRRMYGGQILVNDGLQEAYEELKATAKKWYPQLEEDTGKQAEEPAET